MRRFLFIFIFMSAALAAAVLMIFSVGPEVTAQAPEGLQSVPAVTAGKPIQQPIVFSHKIHAGDVGMDCLYCHIGADEGPVATIPAVESCMGCHKLVGLDRPEVEKLAEFWNNKQPIPWIKVHDISDHARFDHRRHAKAGVECETCHGPVKEMDVITLQQNLTMGFCVNCHKSSLNDPMTPTSLDCATCHK